LIEFCREIVEEMQLAAGNHIVAFHCNEESISGCMDEKLLRQILGNLLSNAIKYSPHGGVVKLALSSKQQHAFFQVQDCGIGIPKADQAQLFDAFHRASNVGTISGTGLGLAIVKKSVGLHGGQIAVESEIGASTTFTVQLPLANVGF
jgi:signal transduction histidine kinase